MSADVEEMTCREFVEEVTEYVEGGLGEARRAELHAHIDECGGCSAYLDQMRQTVVALRRLEDELSSSAAREAALAAFRRHHGR